MPFTTDDLAAIDAAIKKGERSVQFSDRSVTYRSMDELIAARKLIAAEAAGRPKQTLAYARKGFC
jgi:hypothetical protein